MLLRWIAILPVLTALAAAPPRPVHACSCPAAGPLVQPSGEGAPLNSVVFYFGSDAPRFLNLRRADGFFVDSSEEVIGGDYAVAVLLRPYDLLEPNTEYAVYDDAHVIATFTTGSEEDHEPPALTELDGLSASFHPYAEEGCGDSCNEFWNAGGVSRLTIDYETPPEDTVLLVLTLALGGDGGESVQLPWVPDAVPWWDEQSFGYSTCSPRSPNLAQVHEISATLEAYDITAVATLRASATFPVEHCAPAGNGCTPGVVCEPASDLPDVPAEAVDAGEPGGAEGEGEDDPGGCSTASGPPELGLLTVALFGLLRRRSSPGTLSREGMTRD